ncbi:hypothetical protein HYT55_02520 [Candidatus Woesearchaeota archaeon]|nr:hypothetical protein [Candidatus Woesearchaeota archaeon]
MLISFFEEFPTAENLAKLELVKWKTKVYIAAPGLAMFRKVQQEVEARKNILETIYWPVLKKKEGYWISPFSRRKALHRVFSELKKQVVPVMLDLELPTTQHPSLFCTEFLHFSANKKMILDFINSYYGEVYLAEYYPLDLKGRKKLEWAGLHYQNPKVNVVKMFYHSLHDFSDDFLRENWERGRQELGKKYIPALGTIARGIQGDEPILSLEQLKQDLILAREQKMKEVIIFRLGGLTKEYARLLARFAD